MTFVTAWQGRAAVGEGNADTHAQLRAPKWAGLLHAQEPYGTLALRYLNRACLVLAGA